jgi:hypothetical protein
MYTDSDPDSTHPSAPADPNSTLPSAPSDDPSPLMKSINIWWYQLGTSQKHLKRRVLADKHYRMNAEWMKERYNKKKVRTFKVMLFLCEYQE